MLVSGDPPGYEERLAGDDDENDEAVADEFDAAEDDAAIGEYDASNKAKLERLIDKLPTDPCDVFDSNPPQFKATFRDHNGTDFFVTRVTKTANDDLVVDYAKIKQYSTQCTNRPPNKNGPATSSEDVDNHYGVECYLCRAHKEFCRKSFTDFCFAEDGQCSPDDDDEFNNATTGGSDEEDDADTTTAAADSSKTYSMPADSRLTFVKGDGRKYLLSTKSTKPGEVARVKLLFSVTAKSYERDDAKVKPTIEAITFTGDIVYANGHTHCGPHGLIARTTAARPSLLDAVAAALSRHPAAAAAKSLDNASGDDNKDKGNSGDDNKDKGGAIAAAAIVAVLAVLNIAIAWWGARAPQAPRPIQQQAAVYPPGTAPAAPAAPAAPGAFAAGAGAPTAAPPPQVQ